MRILFTTNDAIGSRLIRWGTGDCSHVAFCFDEDKVIGHGLVFHSTGYDKGPAVASMREFLSYNRIIHSVKLTVPVPYAVEEMIYQSVQARTNDAVKGYDFPAVGWFAWRVLLKKLTGRRVTDSNHWQQKNLAICTEITRYALDAIAENVQLPGFVVPKIDYSMVAPAELFRILEAHQYFESDEMFCFKLNGRLISGKTV